MVAEPSRPFPQGGSDRMMALLLKRASASPSFWRALIYFNTCRSIGNSILLPSPDGGSAAPILRGFAFFVARGCVNHFEFILCRGVLALVGNHIDHRSPGTLLSLVHQEP